MEWTKIKVKHFLFSNLRKSMKGDLIDLLCLTAQLEHMPTEEQMRQVCTETALKSLRNQLETNKVSLQLILEKVLEDVEKVYHKKNISALSSKRYRETHKESDGHALTSCDTTEKRREEKIYIVDKKDTIKKFKKPTLDEISAYINEKGFKVSSAKFFSYYESNGWKVGKNKMANWKATVRQWEMRNTDTNTEGRKYAVL